MLKQERCARYDTIENNRFIVTFPTTQLQVSGSRSLFSAGFRHPQVLYFSYYTNVIQKRPIGKVKKKRLPMNTSSNIYTTKKPETIQTSSFLHIGCDSFHYFPPPGD